MNGKYILQHYKLQKRKVNLFTGYRYPIILKFCDLIVFCVFYTVNGLDHNFGAEICTKSESIYGWEWRGINPCFSLHLSFHHDQNDTTNKNETKSV